MRIASLVPYKIVPPVKGGEKAIFLFLKYLAERAQVTSFSVIENNSETIGVLFESVLGSTHQKFRYINPLLFFRIRKQCATRQLKHIVMEHPYFAWLGFALKKWGGLKWIIRSHNIEAARFKSMNKWWWKIMYHYEKFAHQHADFSFFITEEDRQYAIREYGVLPDKCGVVTYGVERNEPSSFKEKELCKKLVCEDLNIPISARLILFNGTLDYAPNRDGLDKILKGINPFLQSFLKESYKIIICGLRLPVEYDELKAWQKDNIIYKGFVADIDLYFKAADVFINPITDGGGIKTKLVEALAANTRAVSFVSGAFGIPPAAVQGHLSRVDDGDCKGFAIAIQEQLNQPPQPVSVEFYNYFSWDAIAAKAVAQIATL